MPTDPVSTDPVSTDPVPAEYGPPHAFFDNPDLESARRQARALQRAVHAGDARAAARVRHRHPGGVPEDPRQLSLSVAQLVLAREYGFASWPRLKAYVDLVQEYRWDNSADPAGDDEADTFCRLACLTYVDDGPERRARARQLLVERPELTSNHIWAAAAAADVEQVRRLLRREPSLATRRGGPDRWTPLFCLAYSRVGASRDAVLSIARLLLDAGADPDEGYLWHGQPCAFTVLTGVFGEGELGPERQPRHPQAHELAQLLLDAGADPNDSQALYNRMFRPDNDHLELLLAYGLGSGDGGPWKARMGALIDPPAALLRGQLRWAVEHDFGARVRLLVEHGVDVREAYDDGRTVLDVARLAGNSGIAAYLASEGATATELDPVDEVLAALMRADVATVDRVRAAHSQVVDEARQAWPGLIVWAAASAPLEVVVLLAELGWDVDARGRADAPAAGAWQTALHHAAIEGDLELARLLVEHGADPGIRDSRFDSTPLGWARYGEQPAMVELLAGLEVGETRRSREAGGDLVLGDQD